MNLKQWSFCNRPFFNLWEILPSELWVADCGSDFQLFSKLLSQFVFCKTSSTIADFILRVCFSNFLETASIIHLLRFWIADYRFDFHKFSNMTFKNLFHNRLPATLTSLHLGIVETILNHWSLSLVWSGLSKSSLHRNFVNLINDILFYLCHYQTPLTSMTTMFNRIHSHARHKQNSFNRILKVGYPKDVDRL